MANEGFPLARRLRAGEQVFSAWCGIPSAHVAEAVARAGFSAVVIDGQHGLWDTASAAAAVAAVRHGGASPIVRVGFGEFFAVSHALDFGAEAVIAPMINTVADARAFAAAAKFPPVGERSWGPHRAMALGGYDDQLSFVRNANDDTLAIAMIETKQALDAVDEIAAVTGIDMLFVGPSDMSLALSSGAQLDPHSPAVSEALAKDQTAARKAGKMTGLFCATADRAAQAAKLGINFITAGSDSSFLRSGVAAALATLK